MSKIQKTNHARSTVRFAATTLTSLGVMAAMIAVPASPAAAESIGVTAYDDQLFQQGSGGVNGSAEGAQLIPTGIAGSYRARGDQFGEVMAVGDFNGDHVDDLAVGSPDEDAETDNVDEYTPYLELDPGKGAVSIIYGSRSQGKLSTSVYPDQMFQASSDGRPETSADDDAQFGKALATGDFNGDSYDDLAIGLPWFDPGHTTNPTGGSVFWGRGAVVVLYGGGSGLSSAGSDFFSQNSPSCMEGGAEPGDYFGSALAAGRFNNDGYDDLAIGVPGEDEGAGAVSVIYSGSGGLSACGGRGDQLIDQATGIVDGVPEGTSYFDDHGDGFGSSLAAGYIDLIGGTQDLVVGVPWEDGGGQVNLIYSNNNGLSGDVHPSGMPLYLSQETQGMEGGQEGGDEFGASLDIGLIDNDGYYDLAIGIPGEDGDIGAVSVIYSLGERVGTYDQLIDQDSGLEGPTEDDDRFGASLAFGNFDDSPGYARTDLAIGVPGEDSRQGAVAIVYADDDGLSADAGRGNQLLQQGVGGINGDGDADEHFGGEVAAGDFGGTGRDALAIGVPLEDYHAGAVNVLYSAPSLKITADIDGTKGNDDWYTSDVTVTWNVVGPSGMTTSGCETQHVTADTAGVSFTCSANFQTPYSSQSAASTIHLKRDATEPVIECDQPDGAWHADNVTLSCIARDQGSQFGLDATGGTARTNAIRVRLSTHVADDTGDADAATGTKVVADQAGNESTAGPIGGNMIDRLAPTITAVRTPAANDAGWNNSDVTVAYTCADEHSGVATCPPDEVVSAEGADQSATGTVVDAVGNTASSTVADINIDKTAPVLTCAVAPQNVWPPNRELIDVTVDINVYDALSGADGYVLEAATSNAAAAGADAGPGHGNGRGRGNGHGNGHGGPGGADAPDIIGFTTGTADTAGKIRAEHDRGADDRVYTLSYGTTDVAGNDAACETTVTISKDRTAQQNWTRAAAAVMDAIQPASAGPGKGHGRG